MDLGLSLKGSSVSTRLAHLDISTRIAMGAGKCGTACGYIVTLAQICACHIDHMIWSNLQQPHGQLLCTPRQLVGTSTRPWGANLAMQLEAPDTPIVLPLPQACTVRPRMQQCNRTSCCMCLYRATQMRCICASAQQHACSAACRCATETARRRAASSGHLPPDSHRPDHHDQAAFVRCTARPIALPSLGCCDHRSWRSEGHCVAVALSSAGPGPVSGPGCAIKGPAWFLPHKWLTPPPTRVSARAP